jgi:hypothetical protein
MNFYVSNEGLYTTNVIFYLFFVSSYNSYWGHLKGFLYTY